MLDEGVHVEAVAPLAGDAPRRGVGLLQITQSLQLGHFVADGSRGAGDLLGLHQILGAHGLAVRDMSVHDSL